MAAVGNEALHLMEWLVTPAIILIVIVVAVIVEIVGD